MHLIWTASVLGLAVQHPDFPLDTIIQTRIEAKVGRQLASLHALVLDPLRTGVTDAIWELMQVRGHAWLSA